MSLVLEDWSEHCRDDIELIRGQIGKFPNEHSREAHGGQIKSGCPRG